MSMTRSKAFTDARELAERWKKATSSDTGAARRRAKQLILREIERLVVADPRAGILTLLAFAHWMPRHTPVSLVDEFQAYLWPDLE